MREVNLFNESVNAVWLIWSMNPVHCKGIFSLNNYILFLFCVGRTELNFLNENLWSFRLLCKCYVLKSESVIVICNGLCWSGAVEVSRRSPVASWLCAMLYCFGSYILADIMLGVSPIDYFHNNSHILLASAVWWGSLKWFNACPLWSYLEDHFKNFKTDLDVKWKLCFCI